MARTRNAPAAWLLRQLAGWEQLGEEDFLIEPMAASMTNHVFKCTALASVLPKHVLLRLYGSPEGLFQRVDDLRNYKLMVTIGMAPKLLIATDEGRIEEFLVTFKAATCQDMRSPRISQCIAQTLASLHLEASFQVYHQEVQEDVDGWICVWDRLQSWHERALQHRPDLVEKFEKQSKRSLEDQIKGLELRLRGASEVLSFCHCDLQQGNIMVHETRDEVRLIDYEYACLAAVEFEIANHWCEWCADYASEMPHLLHATQFPTPQQQKAFIKQYLISALDHLNRSQNQFLDVGACDSVMKSSAEVSQRRDLHGLRNLWNRLSTLAAKPVTDTVIEEFRLRVLEYVPVCHLLWALWSIIQSSVSTVDFNFEIYAEQRFHLYRTASMV